jgi:hypothetical protein
MTTNSAMIVADTEKWSKAKDLYLRLLQCFYERNETMKSKSIALSLLRVIDSLDPSSTTLPGNEYRALIAEVDGDIDAAIQHREFLVDTIGKYAESGTLSKLASKPDEYADQLDLLASLYCQNGRLSEAEEAISKSQKFCEASGLQFDGEDIRREIERARKKSNSALGRRRAATSPRVRRKPITKNQ